MTISQAWLLNLYKAANQVDRELLQILIQKVPKNKAFLSENLTELVKNFRIDIIIPAVYSTNIS